MQSSAVQKQLQNKKR